MVSTALVLESVKGLDFPASKKKIMDYAKKKNASNEVIDVIKRIPDQDYPSTAELMHGVSQAGK